MYERIGSSGRGSTGGGGGCPSDCPGVVVVDDDVDVEVRL